MPTESSDGATFESLGLNLRIVSALHGIGFTSSLPFQAQVLRHTALDFADILAETSSKCGKHTALAIFALQAVLNGSSSAAVVVCSSAASCNRIVNIIKKLSIDGVWCNTVLDESGLQRVGDSKQISVGLINPLSKCNEDNLKNVSTLLVEDVSALQASQVRSMMESVISASPAASMFFLTAGDPSAVPISIRYLFRRSKRRYFYSASPQHQFTYLMCQDQQDRSEINCRLSQLSGLRRVLILTHNKEIRDLKAYLHQQLGFRTYSLQRNSSPGDRENVLSDFLDSQYAILVAMDAFIGIDLMDVDAVIQYYPPQKSMSDEDWSEFVCCLKYTSSVRNPPPIYTIIGPEDFTLASYFMKRVGCEGPILNVAPSHTRFADIVRYPELVAKEKLTMELEGVAPSKSIPLPRSKQDDDTKAGGGGGKKSKGGKK